ncbi:hypothetical protein MSAR_21280 [Mycolicibacterium sarraceniae]|uniref:Uncharacterized protein n=1 Tax=Mycolicibacterium sarraceniae TaxID=1534348 RepID=A0A7I7SPT5_9MYCO|nr:hypothetical protein MSAR_21280 [Mycolicibacterium sarraceniae]
MTCVPLALRSGQTAARARKFAHRTVLPPTSVGVICAGARPRAASKFGRGVAGARVGGSPALMGHNNSVADCGRRGDCVLVDTDAAAPDGRVPDRGLGEL